MLGKSHMVPSELQRAPATGCLLEVAFLPTVPILSDPCLPAMVQGPDLGETVPSLGSPQTAASPQWPPSSPHTHTRALGGRGEAEGPSWLKIALCY